MENLKTLIGKPYPLGATLTPDGVNFAVFSRNGKKVTLNLFRDQDDTDPYASIEFDGIKNRTGDIWHIFVPGLKAGALYVYQVDGPFEPTEGHRFDSSQFLFDPCTSAVTPVSVFKNLPPTYRTPVDKTDIELSESRKFYKFPKCVVIDHDSFDWEGDRPLNLPASRSIIYEVHAKGFTAGKSSGVENPGTYDGFIQKIPDLKDLGVTSVELLPIFEFDEYENTNENPRTGERMKNYWGYSTISFYAPKAGYAADKTPGGCVNEFKRLVKEMHRAGLEVILDVVFNHTAEGNEHGITLNFRGFDNKVYYDLVYNHKEYYMNYSGCGNTVNTNHPVVIEYIIGC
ncbi:MAG: glycogen debranching enzyme, partial [Treponema sp.]|nr:glycogen debranching enzyme [Treponema sp.]